MIYTNMTAGPLLLAGAAISATVLIWARHTRRRFDTRSFIITAALAVLLVAASFLVHDTDASGTGWRTQYGWPHAVYASWKAFESPYPTDHDSMRSFSIGYLLINLTVVVPIAAFIGLLSQTRHKPR